MGSSSGTDAVTSESFADAARRCRMEPGAAVRTPLVASPALGAITGAEVFIKHEQMQRTGSFKYRGALNKLRTLREQGCVSDIVAASSGNHGLAVASAAAVTGYRATIYVPAKADPAKLTAIEAAGARLELVEADDGLVAELTARRVAEERGAVFVSPYNDTDVMAGQGTIGLEILDDCPDVDLVVAAVGGGGMLGGIATAMRGAGSSARFAAVWPEVACSMHRCLEAGEIIDVDEATTLSDGTAGGVEPGAVTFDVLRDVLDHRWLVAEKDIAAAMRWLATHEHLLVEGAAALAVAPLLAARPELKGQRVAVVLCGRNVHIDRFLAVMAA